jgi:3-dehydroquinate synthetase
LPLERPRDSSIDALLHTMQLDKKARAGSVRFALPRAIGAMQGSAETGWTVSAPEAAIRACLAID